MSSTPSPNMSGSYATMSDEGRKARYGLAYLRSICSQAGVGMTENSPDEDVLAVDCTVDFDEAGVRVQVKCTSQWTIAGRSLSFPVKQEWVRRWEKNFFPVYLVVVLVKDPPDGWLRHDSEGTFHATVAFWTRLWPSQADRAAVDVPKNQRFSMESISHWHDDLLELVSPRSVP